MFNEMKRNAKLEEPMRLFESKYKIHFKRKLPKDISKNSNNLSVFEEVNAYGFTLQEDEICGIPYAYEDNDARIYIGTTLDVLAFNLTEEVVVLLGNFEEILKQGKLKAEMERLSKPASIPGSDSL